MKRCPFCAEEIQDAAIVCKHCGRDLPAATTPQASEPVNQPAKKGNRTLWMGLLIFGGLAVVWIIAISTARGRPDYTTRATTGNVESRRNLTGAQLAKIVASADEKCPSAKRIFFQGASATNETWNIECSTGQSFVVTVENSGQSKVLSCAALKMVSKVDCFKTFDEQR